MEACYTSFLHRIMDIPCKCAPMKKCGTIQEGRIKEARILLLGRPPSPSPMSCLFTRFRRVHESSDPRRLPSPDGGGGETEMDNGGPSTRTCLLCG
eukprot:7713114-Alexandrium_andersonii.AAC.1